MEKIIETLWYSYRMENTIECNEERKQIVKMLADIGEKLRADMSAEQVAELDLYEMRIHELGELAEKEAFSLGIRYATKYLLDALYGK